MGDKLVDGGSADASERDLQLQFPFRIHQDVSSGVTGDAAREPKGVHR